MAELSWDEIVQRVEQHIKDATGLNHIDFITEHMTDSQVQEMYDGIEKQV